MARCYNPYCESFYRYGAQGIRVMHRWHRFENFLKDMGDPPQSTVLDRLDNNADYGPSNCRWATFAQSTQNRRNTVWAGTMRVAELAELYGMPASRVYARLKRGWTVAEIIKNQKPIKHGYTQKVDSH